MTFITSLLTSQGHDLSHLMMRLHKDERGDNENLGRLLILALILIPLIILIAFFGDAIAQKAADQWKKVFGTDITPTTG